MAYGILLLRAVLGLTLASHGAQKLFGWFGGPGLKGAQGFFEQLRFPAARQMAFVASATELGCGLLFALGLLTPLAALGLAVVMVTAVGSVHLRNGFFNGNGGYEFNLLIWTVAVTVATVGPRRFSIDRLLGWDDTITGLWWGVGVALVSLAIGGAILALRRAEEPDIVIEEVPDDARADRRETARA